LQLIEDLDENPEIDMVAGWTITGMDSYVTAPQISCGLEQGKLAFPKDLMRGDTELREVVYTGFPLLLMRYGLLKELGAGAFWPRFDPNIKAPFPPGEDIAFCHAARSRGKKIFVDRRVGPLPHLKLRDIAAGELQ